MLPNADILEFLFATVATIVATLTGLIGAFSTFRLQSIDAEIDFLKGMLINKKFGADQSINDFIKGNNYYLLEEIYDLNVAGVDKLKKLITDSGLDEKSNELLIDTDNIYRNQLKYDSMKSLMHNGFTKALVFVFLSLLLLVFVNGLLLCGQWLWAILAVYMAVVGYSLMRFTQQLRQLVFI